MEKARLRSRWSVSTMVVVAKFGRDKGDVALPDRHVDPAPADVAAHATAAKQVLIEKRYPARPGAIRPLPVPPPRERSRMPPGDFITRALEPELTFAIQFNEGRACGKFSTAVSCEPSRAALGRCGQPSVARR